MPTYEKSLSLSLSLSLDLSLLQEVLAVLTGARALNRTMTGVGLKTVGDSGVRLRHGALAMTPVQQN